jgi:hypothetical protein
MLIWLIAQTEWFQEFSYELILTLKDMFNDLFIYIFTTTMSGFFTIISSLGDLFAVIDVAPFLTALPNEVLWGMEIVGFTQAMGIIGTAYTIRFVLRLIPFF